MKLAISKFFLVQARLTLEHCRPELAQVDWLRCSVVVQPKVPGLMQRVEQLEPEQLEPMRDRLLEARPEVLLEVPEALLRSLVGLPS